MISGEQVTALHVKQSTLSRRILALEERLGIKLFERTSRGAEPTENGRSFIEQARRIVTDVDNLRTTARNVSYGLQGRLAVGYCSPLMSGNLKLAFSDFLTRFPDVQFDGIEAAPEKLFNGLQSRTIDVAVAPIGLDEAGLHLSRRGIDLIERAWRPGIVLDRVDELFAIGLHARCGVCRSHPIPGADGWERRAAREGARRDSDCV
jgi:DNA-binding transcriptional LysR family regulator